MNNYSKLLEKFLDIIDWKTLQHSVVKLRTDEKVSALTTKQHLELMIYFHLIESKGLRDLHAAVKFNSKVKEILATPSLSTLSKQNNQRNYQVFVPVMEKLITQCLEKLPEKKIFQKLGSVKLVDSSTISLGLTYFKWAEYRSNKAGIKLHTCYNLNKEIPELVVVSHAKDHDRTKMEDLLTEKNAIYVLDRGYNDYHKYDELSRGKIFFVTRLKDNAKYDIEQELEITDSKTVLIHDKTEILSDCIIVLGKKNNSEMKYRKIVVKTERNKELVFLTNQFQLSSVEIVWLYKKRWDIELFFKWIKQNLKIKKFIGHSFNAVMIQIIVAIIVFISLKILEKKTGYLHGLLQLKRKIKYSITHRINDLNFSWITWLNSS